MHYLKCTKRAVVKTLQYGVRVHDYRPNIEQYYPLVGKILVKIFSKCESFRSNRYARRWITFQKFLLQLSREVEQNFKNFAP